jgi:predicted CoA-binding protein
VSNMQSNHPFLASSRIAVFGISPMRKTFAAGINKNLEESGFQVFPVNPQASARFYPNLSALPDQVESAYVATRPENTSKIIDDLIGYAIKRIWLQNGLFNDHILNKCREAGIETYTGCLMMYLPSAGFIRKFHRVVHEFLRRNK